MKLKQCPFCGGKADIGYGQPEDKSEITITVLCQNCNIGIFKYRKTLNEYGGFKTIEDATEAWNKRDGEIK